MFDFHDYPNKKRLAIALLKWFLEGDNCDSENLKTAHDDSNLMNIRRSTNRKS